MRPPIRAHTKIKEKFIKDMAKAKSLLIPALEKKNMVMASRKPKPPMEMGKSVIAAIIGIYTKK